MHPETVDAGLLQLTLERRLHRYQRATPNPFEAARQVTAIRIAVKGVHSPLRFVVADSIEDLTREVTRLDAVAADPDNPKPWRTAATRLAATLRDVLAKA